MKEALDQLLAAAQNWLGRLAQVCHPIGEMIVMT